MSDKTDTPQDTLRAATHENAFSQGWATLLGTVIKPESVSALIRFSSGRIRSVTLGDKVGNGRVVAIDDGLVMVDVGGQSKRLSLPGV